MAQLNIMHWNLGGVDRQRLARAGSSYAALIASVMQAASVPLAGFSGILDGQGGLLGQQIVNELDGRWGAHAWNQQASPPLGQGLNEQYLFVWNLQALSAYKPPGLEFWLWTYPDPGHQGRYLGFPRPEGQSPDLPPFTMFFRLAGGDKWMPVAILHAPPWQLGDGQGIRAGLSAVAAASALDLGNGALIMGTFNVPANDDVRVPGSNGELAFGPLAGPQGKYIQGMSGIRTALTQTPIVAISDEEAYAETSDSFFLRRNSQQGGISGADPGLLPVIGSSIGRLDDNENWVAAPFSPALANVEAKSTGRPEVPAGPDSSYDRFDDAFTAYRLYVSDHVPIVMTINY